MCKQNFMAGVIFMLNKMFWVRKGQVVYSRSQSCLHGL